MEWKEAIKKYAEHKEIRRKENRDKIASRINRLLKQLPKLKNKDIEEITQDIWIKSIQKFRKKSKYYKNWEDLNSWKDYRELVTCFVFARDNYKCRYCGRKQPKKLEYHLEHIKPSKWIQDLDNLACACSFCNYGKQMMGEKEFKKELIEIAKAIKNKFPEKF